MKYIEKGEEPLSFTTWKAQANDVWTPTWETLQNPEKKAVMDTLLREQGALCAYCCQRIGQQTSHIEHVVSRDACIDLALDFQNMVASCPGEPEEGEDYPEGNRRPPELIHCGHAKDEWHDPPNFVDPRDPDCEQAFSFTARGEIRVAQGAPRHDAADETIRRLNLDAKPLRRQRKAVIGEELDRLVRLFDIARKLQHSDVEPRLAELRARGTDGTFAPFAPVLVDILDQRVQPLA